MSGRGDCVMSRVLGGTAVVGRYDDRLPLEVSAGLSRWLRPCGDRPHHGDWRTEHRLQRLVPGEQALPLLMSQRRMVQRVAMAAPVRHESVHEAREPLSVSALEQMSHLMND